MTSDLQSGDALVGLALLLLNEVLETAYQRLRLPRLASGHFIKNGERASRIVHHPAKVADGALVCPSRAEGVNEYEPAQAGGAGAARHTNTRKQKGGVRQRRKCGAPCSASMPLPEKAWSGRERTACCSSSSSDRSRVSRARASGSSSRYE